MSSTEQIAILSQDDGAKLVCIQVQGYFNDRTGAKLLEVAEKPIESGHVNVVLDFSKCDLINSVGIGKLLELIINLDENHGGQTVFCGLSNLLNEALTVAGIMTVAQVAPDLPRAVEIARTPR